MKSFIAGLLTIIALGLVGYYTFKATTSFISRLNPSASPSPTSSVSPSPSTTSTPRPSTTPEPSMAPTTKGGLPLKSGTVKGATTIKKTTTTTTYTNLTLVRSSVCPISYTSEVRDITTPLTLRYSLKDGFSFALTVWNRDGNELVHDTTYSGTSGTIKTISGVDYFKARIESKTCNGNSDNWLTLTAER